MSKQLHHARARRHRPAGVAVLLSSAARPSAHSYTTLDHPSLPCNLSEEAVANWGETSAHLPLACTYDE